MRNADAATMTKAERIEVELILSLFDALISAVIMTAGFVLCGALMAWTARDPMLLSLVGVGTFASLVRMGIAWRGGKRAGAGDMAISVARSLERRFGLSYLSFAFILGLFGARVFMLPDPRIHMLTMCLLVGYAAGVAAGIGLRPRIAIPAMVLAIAPTILTTLYRNDSLYWAASAMMAAMLGGAIQNLRGRHKWAAEEISRRITFATLARQDVLTELPNRLALREWYEERAVRHGDALVAVHCLDLNGFKPVNDTHGHPVGDALLAAVAGRIAHSIRGSDIAARLGGDEFVVVQFGIAREEEAVMLATRLRDAVARPFHIGDRTLTISTSVGYVVAPGRQELEQLLVRADEALYAAKHGDRAVRRHQPPPERVAA